MYMYVPLALGSTSPLHLGRDPVDNCGQTTITCESCVPFQGQQLTYTENTTFSLTIGPSGGERGYMAITGMAYRVIAL